MTKDEYKERSAARYKDWFNGPNDNADLADILSDYHKDTHGFRYRGYGLTRERLCIELTRLDMYHETMRETFAGREELRANGWVVPEEDPVQQIMADHLALQREEDHAHASAPEGVWRAEIAH